MSSVRERLATTARAVEPILNRVVFVGPPVVDLLVSDPSFSTSGLTFTDDAIFQLLSTSMIDRLGVDLQKRGHSRIAHTERSDRWAGSGDIAFDLVQVRADDGDPSQVWLEYATLLTLPMQMDGAPSIRIAGAPAILALELASFVRSGARPLESEELERAVLLIAGRREIEKEIAMAPAELRSMVGSSLATLTGDATLELLVQRTLPDAALLPALGRRVRDRIARLAC